MEKEKEKEKNSDELTVKSTPSNSKPSKIKASDTKEEGELSSSDNDTQTHDVRPVCSTVPASIASPISSSLPPKDKCNPGIQTASADICPRTSISTMSQKIRDNAQIVNKASTPWGASRKANSNLVISFSDDSGSELEECSKVRTSKSHSDAVRHFKPPTSTLDRSNKLRSMTRNKVMANKLPLSQVFIPSMTKNHKAYSKGAAGPSFAEQGSKIRAFSGNLQSQGRGNDQGMNLNTSKLQDLRQQIAIRESKLKLKSAQQNKESLLVTNQDYIVTNSKPDLGRKGNNTISQFPPLGPKEPNVKRMKTSGSYSSKLSLNEQQLHSLIAAKFVWPQEPGEEIQNIKGSYNQKGKSLSREEASVLKQSKEDIKHVAASPSLGIDLGKVQDDITDIVANGNHSDLIGKQVDPHPLVVLDQATALPNVASNVQSQFDNVEFRRQSDGLQPSASTAKSFEGTPPQSAYNVKIPEPCSNFFKSLINCKSSGTAFGNSSSCLDFGNFDLQSLFEIEESLDKDLEEAQDCRRQCEIEERNAFKIYSRAQRALIEANSRCLDLYNKRELFSAHFHSFCMNNPGSVSSSRQQEDMIIDVDHLNSMSGNANITSPLYQKHSEYNSSTRLRNDLNMQHENAGPINTSNLHENGQNLGSEPGSCSDLGGNTVDPLPFKGNNIADRICSPSVDPNISLDGDEESLPSDHEMIDSYNECYVRKKHFEDDQMEAYNMLKKNHCDNNIEDSLRLEAKLRSELFARLGTRNLSKACNPCNNIQTSVEQGTENDARNDRTQQNNTELTVGLAVGSDVDLISKKNESALLSGKGDQQFGFGGTDRCKTPDEIHGPYHFENLPSETPDLTDSDDNEPFSREGSCSKTTFSFTPLTMNSVLQHMKVISSVSIEVLLTRTLNLGFPEDGDSLEVDRIHWRKFIENSVLEIVRPMLQSDGSYTDDLAIDPSWPLCMYELRGKCNNDECPWQHMKDFSFANRRQCQHGHINSSDETKVFKYEDRMTPPTYLVGIDILKADSRSYGPVLAQRSSQCWQNFFSISLTLPNLLRKDASADGLFLHDARIEAKGSWNRPSSYFQRGGSVLSQLKQGDENLALETALIIINQETNSREGMKKALPVLSRAVENNPKSIALWAVYLLIFYSYTTTGGKDDMFSYAVKHNGQSYELWLMYINSRMNLDARLAAYDSAISALCDNIFSHNLDGKDASAHILDLILQMTNCLCMSGNVEKAIQRIFGLLQVAMDSDEPYSFMHSDMLTCLNISDKCIFWVCVVYLVLYRKLPHAIVQQLECEKELIEIEWPAVQLTNGEKLRASRVVKKVVDFADSCLNNESPESKCYQKSIQMFAVNHIRCLMAFEDIEFSRNLLDKYVKLYPSCPELILLDIRARKHDFGDATVVAFEQAIRYWPKEVPGIQCIWNQYAEYLLRNGRIKCTEELMARWFNSTSKMDCSKTRTPVNSDCDSLHLLDHASGSIVRALDCSPSEVDVVFWYLNHSVHKLLVNDQLEARLAFDNALRAASAGTFRYCMREYAMFLLTDGSLLNEAASVGGIRSILEGYLNDARAFPVCEPLSRRFINDIKKPRVRLLVSNTLSPISPDVSLVNCILEVWYGPSLLPQKFNKPKELVDFVETILEMLPSNYQLVLSVCKQLSNGDNYSSQAASPSLIFWACSNLITAIFNCVPIPPEFIWVEAANILVNVKGLEAITERFHKRALSVYPFSVQLWKSYYSMCKTRGDTSTVLQEVNERGIELNEPSW
uniref:Putative zinc-finger domain-containing protein n=1 Tax=Cucumis melo TaxID=3656 RepID=A0A9I9DWU1_CUCME